MYSSVSSSAGSSAGAAGSPFFAGEERSTFQHKPSIKSFPVGDMSPWKIAMRQRLEKKVHESRAKIAASAREKQMAVSDLLMDMMAEEDALRKDNKSLTSGPPSPLDVEAGDSATDTYSLHDPADDALTDDERIQILLHLEETFFRRAKEEAEGDDEEDSEEAALQREIESCERIAYEEAQSLINAAAEFAAGDTAAAGGNSIGAGGSGAGSTTDAAGSLLPSSRQQQRQGKMMLLEEDEEDEAYWDSVMAEDYHRDEHATDRMAAAEQRHGAKAGKSSKSSSSKAYPSFPVSLILGDGSKAPLCPQCACRPLEEFSKVIFCRNPSSCGPPPFRMDTHGRAITLASLRSAIVAATEAHGAAAGEGASGRCCQLEPVLRVEESFDLKALYVACEEERGGCGYFVGVM
jgi:Replication protein A interacting C-terminal